MDLMFCIFLVVALIVICFVHAEFNGLPWKKQRVSKKLQKYAEKKYNIQTTIKEKYYNFRNGGYGVLLYETEKGEDALFTVIQIGENIEDSYS
ncbi:hypothetical protein [Priestia taiwanensis]|uniref:YfjL-like N-terminal domain-containing protein n=1 Tax=Priestia taiwanensis TaxID=1347902 RepID=A0A917AMY2_9BACI|nr:hypothetical protein [Priestia taiwanensis]MBM7362070.1 hypothetical protein [Priestia taiwanensis]GGE59185.1 hypothetical protein GCM10007140_06930 [Priestia taiwanensis]